MHRYHLQPRRRAVRAAAAACAVLALGAGHAAGNAAAHHRPSAPSRAAAVAISYVRHELGKPYCWGGTGPSCFDCSGLVMEAYASAGIGLPRTSQLQWAGGRHVSSPEPGDLVYFAGAGGTTASPGHVAIVVSPRRHLMIEAYATGFPVRKASWTGRDTVGFTRPAKGT